MAKQENAPRKNLTEARGKAKPQTQTGSEEAPSSSLDVEELRRSLRARRPLAVTYANLSQSAVTGYRYYRSATVDLSRTGLGLIVDEKIEKGDLLQVVVSLPVKPFVVTGLARAVWVRLIASGERYRAGLLFVQRPTEVDEHTIEKLV